MLLCLLRCRREQLEEGCSAMLFDQEQVMAGGCGRVVLVGGRMGLVGVL